jgi:hypothetical protein
MYERADAGRSQPPAAGALLAGDDLDLFGVTRLGDVAWQVGPQVREHSLLERLLEYAAKYTGYYRRTGEVRRQGKDRSEHHVVLHYWTCLGCDQERCTLGPPDYFARKFVGYDKYAYVPVPGHTHQQGVSKPCLDYGPCCDMSCWFRAEDRLETALDERRARLALAALNRLPEVG